jgi:hypothetical protein
MRSPARMPAPQALRYAMDRSGTPPEMNQAIFNAGLPVETVSLYLLCCGLAEAGTQISKTALLQIWNSSEAALTRGLDELESLNILRKILSDRKSRSIYRMTDHSDWTLG